jgi:hypothetical protein
VKNSSPYASRMAVIVGASGCKGLWSGVISSAMHYTVLEMIYFEIATVAVLLRIDRFLMAGCESPHRGRIIQDAENAKVRRGRGDYSGQDG